MFYFIYIPRMLYVPLLKIRFESDISQLYFLHLTWGIFAQGLNFATTSQ